MQEYTMCPANYIKKLPDDFDLQIGALVEPLAVGWHAVATSPYKGALKFWSDFCLRDDLDVRG